MNNKKNTIDFVSFARAGMQICLLPVLIGLMAMTALRDKVSDYLENKANDNS